MANEQLDLQLRYAWDWFSYHAQQRLTAFNFFLILMGAVLVGYAQAVNNHLPGLGACLGFLGWLVALAFWAMDVRNEELVNCGRAALDDLERQLGLSIRSDDEGRRRLCTAMPGHVGNWLQGLGPSWFTHRRWLRTVITVMGFLSWVPESMLPPAFRVTTKAALPTPPQHYVPPQTTPPASAAAAAK